MTKFKKRAMAVSAVLAAFIMPSANAQQQQMMPPGEPSIDPDENGVNLASGMVYPPPVTVGIGPWEYKRIKQGYVWTDTVNYGLAGSNTQFYANGALTGTLMCQLTVSLGLSGKVFVFPCYSQGPFTPLISDGSSLVSVPSGSGTHKLHIHRSGWNRRFDFECP